MANIQCGGVITPTGVSSCWDESEWLVMADGPDALPRAVCARHLRNAVTVISLLSTEESGDGAVRVAPL